MKAMNVILIALDTLRADHVGLYGYKKPTSPSLDRFSDKSIAFENFFAPGIPTQPTYTTLVTKQYSITHGIVTHGGKEKVNPGSPWLPEIMLQSGYATSAVDNLALMRNWFLRGYEFYINPSIAKNYSQVVSAEDVTKRALEWLETYHKERFFLFVHYWDPHTPYIPPDENLIHSLYPEGKNPFRSEDDRMEEFYNTPHGKEWSKTWLRKNGKLIKDPEFVEALYDAEIRYMDDYLGNFFVFLENKNLLENTIVIILSDHGEIMYRHPGFFDHHGLYEGNIHCPLIIYVPEAQPRRVNNLIQHVDIAPTILELLGILVPSTMEGKSAAAHIKGESEEALSSTLYTQECTYQAKWGIRTSQYKLILSRGEDDIHGLPPVELYDLEKDPDEQENIADKRRELAEELKGKLENWIEIMAQKNNLREDPLKKRVPPLAKNWKRFVSKYGYW